MREFDKNRTTRPPTTPREVVVAGTELIVSLAKMTNEHNHPEARYTYDRNAHLQLIRALTGLFQLEGGRISIKWIDKKLTINKMRMPASDTLKPASHKLFRHFGKIGIAGVVFRFIPDPEQTRQFFHALASMGSDDINRLGLTGETVNLSGELAYSGIQLLLGVPGRNYDSNFGNVSGISARTVLEDLISNERMDWIGSISADFDPRLGPMDERIAQQFCLGSYVNLVTTSLRLVRSSTSLRSGDKSLPTLALHRCISQVAQGFKASVGLMQACMLLGARDLSPSRRLAHMVLVCVGLAHQRGLGPKSMTEHGLAAFVYGLRLHFHQLGERQDWAILQLLAQEEALTAWKVRAVHAAALVNSDTSQFDDPLALTPPPLAEVVSVSADFAGALDGTLTGQHDQAPLPIAGVLRFLDERTSCHGNVSYSRKHISELFSWLGSTPPGTMVKLRDGQQAVIVPSETSRVVALPLLGVDQQTIEQPAMRVTLGRSKDGRRPTSLDILGVTAARPLIHLAAQALFIQAQECWRGIV